MNKYQSKSSLAAVVAALCLAAFGAQAAQPITALGQCIPATDAEARAAWEPMQDSSKAELTTIDGAKALRFRCNYATSTADRASWDQRAKLDLSSADGIEFKVLCRNFDPVNYFAIYFQGENGWYTGSFFPERTDGWNTISIQKSDFQKEGEPGGWDKLRTVRISAWKGGTDNTEFFVKDMRATGRLGEDTFVLVLRGTNGADNRPDQSRGSRETADRVTDCLQQAHLRCIQVNDADVSIEDLRKVKLVVLPQNGEVPQSTASALLEYLVAGGKVIGFYTVPESIRAALNFGPSQAMKAPVEGAFSRVRMRPGALAGAPAELAQTSYWINSMEPVAGKSRVLADWLDARGQPSGQAAVIASTNCMWMTHILLPGDRDARQKLLLAMAGALVPELLREPVSTRLAAIGQLGGYRNFEQLTNALTELSRNKPAARSALAEAVQLRNAALLAAQNGQLANAIEQAEKAAKQMEQAFCAAQQSERGEFRAFWCHSAFGVRGMTWDEAVGKLAANGFTAIIPNMMWGGAVFYPSEFLPLGKGMEGRGDPVRECLDACRKHGIAMHVWKVNWYLGSAVPDEFAGKMRREGRLQADASGNEKNWLCPSHPANRKLEIDSMVELARKYPVDGLHFDYIRYPDNDHCFCQRCKETFEKASGLKIGNWPKDLQGEAHERWQQWRRDNITAVVRAVSEQARAVRSGIKISAAVFSDWSNDRNTVAQDWKLWCEKGYMDFVCPMDYSDSDRRFENLVKRQKEWASGVPYYPGIGLSTSGFGADRVIGQILITRKYRTGGFVIFNYGEREASGVLPLLGMGVTAPNAAQAGTK